MDLITPVAVFATTRNNASPTALVKSNPYAVKTSGSPDFSLSLPLSGALLKSGLSQVNMKSKSLEYDVVKTLLRWAAALVTLCLGPHGCEMGITYGNLSNSI